MFTKNDKEKLRLSLVEPKFIEGIAKILTKGAEKYSTDNWKKCEDVSRYKDALLRHILAYTGGEINDPETGQSHLYHAACNLMFLDWFDKSKKVDVSSFSGAIIIDDPLKDGLQKVSAEYLQKTYGKRIKPKSRPKFKIGDIFEKDGMLGLLIEITDNGEYMLDFYPFEIRGVSENTLTNKYTLIKK